MDAILSATRCPECLLLVYQQIITQTHIIGKFAAYYVVSLNVHMPPKNFKCNFSIYCFCFAIFLFVLEMRKTHMTTFYLFYFGDFCMYFSCRKIKQLWLIYVVSLYVRILPQKF